MAERMEDLTPEELAEFEEWNEMVEASVRERCDDCSFKDFCETEHKMCDNYGEEL